MEKNTMNPNEQETVRLNTGIFSMQIQQKCQKERYEIAAATTKIL